MMLIKLSSVLSEKGGKEKSVMLESDYTKRLKRITILLGKGFETKFNHWIMYEITVYIIAFGYFQRKGQTEQS